MWDVIVLIPYHCLSIYFPCTNGLNVIIGLLSLVNILYAGASIEMFAVIVSGYESAFTGRSPTSGTKTGTIKFGTMLSNYGSDYDQSSGNFTCEHPGIYMFHFHLYRYPTSSYSSAQCYIQKNGSNKVIAYSYPYSSAYSYYYQSSNSVVLHLNQGDVITVGGCTAIGSIYSYTSFSGFLLKAD